ncbi:MAG: SDR family oxidoreductase [Alphaproteobacteria bacterium]|nr:SDR family oxidoreductase [Alphaproteobacteria bacterium]
MPALLITGANRGLGLGLLKLYAAEGWRVLAVCRDPARATELSAVASASNGRVTLHRADMEDIASIDALGATLKGVAIDVLVNMASYYGKAIMTEPGGLQEFGASDYADWRKIHAVNVLAVMRLCEVLVENVAASQRKVIVNLSSIAGSIGTIKAGGMGGRLYAYRASKAALNMITRAMAEDLRPRGITVVPLHPGWVKTDMGGPKADLDVATSTAGMKKVIDGLTLEKSGRYWVYDGSNMPW